MSPALLLFTVREPNGWLVLNQLDPNLFLPKAACNSHFSCIILTRGNAFDVFRRMSLRPQFAPIRG